LHYGVKLDKLWLQAAPPACLAPLERTTLKKGRDFLSWFIMKL